MTLSTNKRDSAIDALGGLMICFMIFRHCFMGTGLDKTFVGGVLTYYPLMFYMGWFFFKGGLYYNNSSTLSGTLIKGTLRLLIPYLVFSVLAIIIEIIVHGFIEGKPGISQIISDIPIYMKREGVVNCNAPLWFLVSFFLVRLFYAFSQTIHIPNYVVLTISLCSAFLLYRLDLPIGVYFENIALGLFFFSSGSLFKKKLYNNYVFYFSLAFYISFLCYSFIKRDIICEFRINSFSPYLPTVLFSLAGCISANNIFKRISKLQNRHLITIGRNAIVLFSTHFILIRLSFYLNSQLFHFSPLFYFALTIILLMISLPVVTHQFAYQRSQWMIGNDNNVAHGVILNNKVVFVSLLGIIIIMTYYVIHVYLSVTS